MKSPSISTLKKQYEFVCDEYVKKFVKKQGYQFSFWVGDEVGGIACFIEQYFFSLNDIVWDVNAKCPKGLIFSWQDDCLENPKKSINYFSYSKGLRIDE